MLIIQQKCLLRNGNKREFETALIQIVYSAVDF
jgi:hypothetical protein